MFIIILDDGTTYSAAVGCKIACVPDGTEDVGEWIRNNPGKLVPINLVGSTSSVEFNGDILVVHGMEAE